jgi:hypothetical protein
LRLEEEEEEQSGPAGGGDQGEGGWDGLVAARVQGPFGVASSGSEEEGDLINKTNERERASMHLLAIGFTRTDFCRSSYM